MLAAVALVGYFLVPSPQHSQLFREILASALYYENWELISSQLSYAAAGPSTSPLQHFWSLAVQGQFFAVWPVLFAIVAAVLVRSRLKTRSTLLFLILAGTVLSAWYAFTLVQFDQQTAYFSSFTRFWELGAGALLAFLPTHIRFPRFMREALAWSGIAMIVSSGFILDGGQLFPGPAALWPVLATLFIILGAVTGDAETSVAQALSVSPLRFLSRISYQLYLWHWPILIFYLLGRDQEAVGPRGAAVVLAISVFAAWVTERLLHKDRSVPAGLSKHRPLFRTVPRPLVATAAVSLVAIGAGLALATDTVNQQAALAAASQPSPDHPGALALTDKRYENFESLVPPVPEANSADADLPNLYSRKCVQNWRSEPGMDQVLVCEDLPENPTPATSAKVVVMSGGSHVLHWYPAYRVLADKYGWELIVVDKDACRLTVGDDGDGLSQMCRDWNISAMPIILDREPAAVVTVATKTPEIPGDVEISYPGQVRAWQALAEHDVPVIAMRDTPRFFERMPECTVTEPDPKDCGRARSDIFADEIPAVDGVTIPASTAVVDLTDAFCSQDLCEPIVGNVLAYRDADHMTATYSRSLAPALEAALKVEAPWLFR